MSVLVRKKLSLPSEESFSKEAVLPYHYTFIKPVRCITIDQLYTVHYFENHRNYYFSGERHDFWELVYVDRGEVIADTDWREAPLHLEQGDLLLYRPQEFHRTYANNITPCNLLVVAFSCSSPAMEFFMENTFFRTQGEVRRQLALLLQEAQKGFSQSLADPAASVRRRADAEFGSEQLAVMMLEWLLISLCRRGRVPGASAGGEEERLAGSYVEKAVAYLKAHLHDPVTLADVCGHINISRSQLQKMFHRRTGVGVMHYLIQLRMEEAKFLICSGSMNFTEISQQFCYSSVHHFSKQFHQTVGMSPSEYAESVRAMTDSFPT